MLSRTQWIIIAAVVVALLGYAGVSYFNVFATVYRSEAADIENRFFPPPKLDKAEYDARLLRLAHIYTATSSGPVGESATTTQAASSTQSLWPVHTTYPDAGAILPFKRIVAYYGNFYSTKMGVLGEYPEHTVLDMLASTSEEWAKADPTTPIVSAVQYIAVVAQNTPGKEGTYILRMPDSQIDKALSMAVRIHGLLILDVQVGQSTLERELPLLKRYLALPQVELAIDPEFSMKYGGVPGTVIGTYDAKDINYAAEYLASLVKRYALPPKVLIVHRFTEAMVTHYKQIKPLPQVEIVMDMDGWGSQERKINTYDTVIAAEPVQFTGIKLFYHADRRPPSTGMLTPAQVLSLTPAPIYIQYQ